MRSLDSAKPRCVKRLDIICRQCFAGDCQFVDLAVKVANFLGTVFHGRYPVSDFRLAESEFELVGGDGRHANVLTVDVVSDSGGDSTW